MFKLTPGIQSYDWGKKGGSSLAAQLATTSIEGFEVDENKTYAEVSLIRSQTVSSVAEFAALDGHTHHPAIQARWH